MSRDASIELDWADGRHTFRLAWGELIKLQEACDAGPMVVLHRLTGSAWRLEDISATIRLGLIGGGATPEAALKLVRDYVEARPPLENLMLAQGILSVAVVGPPDEPPGEPKRRRTKKPA
jgi:hypothetical protein